MNINKDQLFLKVKDHSVSKESFDLYHDSFLDMLITSPKPDPDSLAGYYESENYISHTDSKRSLFEKAYHFVKAIALKNKLALINLRHPIKGNLLDIGAGTGDFLAVAKSNGWSVIGIEPNEKAKSIAVVKDVAFVNETQSLGNNSIDVITMWHVLEHVPNLELQLTEMKRLLKTDGIIVIAVPNFKSFDAGYYKDFWAAYDVPRHLWHFSKGSIEKLFAEHGLVLEAVLPMKFDAFYVSLLSEKYKTGKMNYLKAVGIGLKSNNKARKSGEYSSHTYILKNAK